MRPHLSHALVKLLMSRVSVNALSALFFINTNLVLNETATTTCIGIELFAHDSPILIMIAQKEKQI
jgi:hypothetical protein